MQRTTEPDPHVRLEVAEDGTVTAIHPAEEETE
jgi:hypothetical protein